MIKFDGVTQKFYLGNTVLKDLSFEIGDSEFVFLVGPSGAGKTTILKLILGAINPTSGSVTVDNFNLTSSKFNRVENLRRKIGIVFQDFKILPDKNIYENIALSLNILGMNQKQVDEEIKQALELVNLPGKARLFPAQLSAGELQRVAIARAIVGHRDIILADEPTGNLDPKTTWEIMKIFKKLEGKKTIIIATHNTEIVNSLQKRVLVIREGKLVRDQKKGGYEL